MAFWDGNQELGTSQRGHDLGRWWGRDEPEPMAWERVTVCFANWDGYSCKLGIVAQHVNLLGTRCK